MSTQQYGLGALTVSLSLTPIRARDQIAIPDDQKLEAFLKFVFNFISLNLVSFQILRQLRGA